MVVAEDEAAEAESPFFAGEDVGFDVGDDFGAVETEFVDFDAFALAREGGAGEFEFAADAHVPDAGLDAQAELGVLPGWAFGCGLLELR